MRRLDWPRSRSPSFRLRRLSFFGKFGHSNLLQDRVEDLFGGFEIRHFGLELSQDASRDGHLFASRGRGVQQHHARHHDEVQVVEPEVNGAFAFRGTRQCDVVTFQVFVLASEHLVDFTEDDFVFSGDRQRFQRHKSAAGQIERGSLVAFVFGSFDQLPVVRVQQFQAEAFESCGHVFVQSF
ncbi:hypothetical protein RB8463 [Rhodopirellula baltica SH 1]|uniref:Uncharacterized protein n=1 Tax=Rhodopirellula baltica (strain DSM 10527 / NCIMB 13988 / SH1) TaxID=243090 RepID=Q7UFN1_RHOBA|nr:hypothetical protein RB8463 [Rhodopirellula baltica SH 1]